MEAELDQRRRVEESLRSRTLQQVAIAALGRSALEGAELPALFEAAVSLAARLLSVERAAVFVQSGRGGNLEIAAAIGWGDGPADRQTALAVTSAQVKRTLESGEPVVMCGGDTGDGCPAAKMWRTPSLASGMTVVVPGPHGRPRGVVAVHSKDRRMFRPEHIAILQAIGTVLGGGIARRESEDAMFAREQELRALVEHAPDIISRFDRELRRVYVNPAIEAATGQPAESFIGRTNHEVGIAGPAVDRWELVAGQVFRSGREQSIEVSWDTPTGTRLYQTRITPEFAPDGTVQTLLTVARDITEMRQADTERASLVQEVFQREARLQELVSRMLTDRTRDANRAVRLMEYQKLTRREREVLRLVVDGQTNAQIARALGLGVGTVKNHIARILPKLDATDRTQAAVRAVESGLIDADEDY